MKILPLSLVLLAPLLAVSVKGSFLQYLQVSAGRGEAESQFILGLAYCDGWDGTIHSGSTAAKWRELASELGDLRPLLVTGLLRHEKVRFEQDRAAAVKWLGLAAERGDNYARVILGDMLLEGDGVPADWRRGKAWIVQSARAGFAPAQFRLGVIYTVGDRTTPKDDVEALAWFILAAESGSQTAREYRDERTGALGREVARLAIRRSRVLLAKG
jgi:TPR repeat protein